MRTYLNESQTIGTSAINVLPNRQALNQRRLSFIITNTGATTISLSIDKEAVASSGIILYTGGSIELTANGTYLPPNYKISAISSAANGTLSVYEEVEQ